MLPWLSTLLLLVTRVLARGAHTRWLASRFLLLEYLEYLEYLVYLEYL